MQMEQSEIPKEFQITPSSPTPNGKKKENPLLELQKIKQNLKKENIYVYECWNCLNPLMLHEKKCRFCQAKNDYYNHELDPNEASIKKAQEALKKFVMDVP